MNGTVIDIEGISVNIKHIYMQDSTDKAYILTLSDGKNEVNISIIYGKIESVRSSK
jgi:hypothetical protein